MIGVRSTIDSAMLGDSGYDRRADDYYATPEWVTRAVLPLLAAHGVGAILEPACGDGAMARILAEQHVVVATDLVDRGYGASGEDFLQRTTSAEAIVTNPPYGPLAARFIAHALTLTRATSGVVAMLLRHEYDCARSRAKLFQHPFAAKLTLRTRPRWIADSTGSPRHNYAWFLWDWRHQGLPHLHFPPPVAASVPDTAISSLHATVRACC